MMRSSLEIHSLATGQTRVVLQTDALIAAPNFHPSGRWLLVNGDGRLYRVPLDNPALHQIDIPPDLHCNNDHGFLQGGTVIFSAHRGHGAEIFRLDPQGPTLLSPHSPSWFHATSPDGRSMTYAAARQNRIVDIYVKPFDGAEQSLTQGEGHCDAPDFSADGKSIFYNSDRSGHAQIWVMKADGTGQRQLFHDTSVNWFPHPSPDGKHLLYLAYPTGTQGHPSNLQVTLTLTTPTGTTPRPIVTLTGGQGTINSPPWSPDSTQFAFIRFAPDTTQAP